MGPYIFLFWLHGIFEEIGKAVRLTTNQNTISAMAAYIRAKVTWLSSETKNKIYWILIRIELRAKNTVIEIKLHMAIQRFSLLSLFLVFSLSLGVGHGCDVDSEAAVTCECKEGEVKRSSFPEGFKFGAAASAYQFEGAFNHDGKGLSNWDYYTHAHPERIADGSNGDVATNSYLRYKDDVRLGKDTGLNSYRFSISWSRILPHGRLFGGRVNQKGIEYYNKLIDELLLNGIEPYVTLFHWDVPLTLEKRYGGFLSRRIVKEFQYYADVCFKHFGDRVKNWITLNEPWSFSRMGYSTGDFAPGRCSNHTSCLGGDSGTEPYIVTHHQLLAHAAAIRLYKKKYQTHQNGVIGITLVSYWFVPYSNSTADRLAQKRSFDFMLGWFMDPIIFGSYPENMRTLVGSRLPTFTPRESRMLKGSFDFIGMNYYTATYVQDAPRDSTEGPFSYLTDSQATFTSVRDGIPIGKQAGISWLYIYPKGIRGLLDYIRTNYNNPPIVITENGVGEANDPSLTLEQSLNDNMRVDYLHDHMCCLLDAIKDGSQLKGYFIWSLLDNYEWNSGYTVRFGLHYVDYNNNLLRYPKKSAVWLKSILKKELSISNNNIRLDGKNNSSRYSI